MDDLAMDMETLHRVLKNMKVPQDKINNYDWLLKNLDSQFGTHPDYEQAIKLLKLVTSRLKN